MVVHRQNLLHHRLPNILDIWETTDYTKMIEFKNCTIFFSKGILKTGKDAGNTINVGTDTLRDYLLVPEWEKMNRRERIDVLHELLKKELH